MERVEVKDGQNRLKVEMKGQSYVQVTDQQGRAVAHLRGANPSASLLLPPGQYLVTTDGKLLSAAADTVELPKGLQLIAARVRGGASFGGKRTTQTTFEVRLSVSGAVERHPVDGIPVLPADGVSYMEIELRAVDESGKLIAGAVMSKEEVYLRSTGGLLQDANGNPLKGPAVLVRGKAQVRLVSEPYRRVVTVQVVSEGPTAMGSTLTVEFT